MNSLNSVDIGLNGFARGQVLDLNGDQAQVIYEVDKERGQRRIIGCLDRNQRRRMPDWSAAVTTAISASITTNDNYHRLISSRLCM